ncbi:aryl hydrocarbon receptor-like [Rhincodon typus]|uniref:aryl hydrocarbon receptor-like n=1 Tax=Rhincodon typus TaxID=259920 RepID=UPI00202F950E|nr:aryl hydrocarbon receptor-like [Rhincodon typus]
MSEPGNALPTEDQVGGLHRSHSAATATGPEGGRQDPDPSHNPTPGPQPPTPRAPAPEAPAPESRPTGLEDSIHRDPGEPPPPRPRSAAVPAGRTPYAETQESRPTGREDSVRRDSGEPPYRPVGQLSGSFPKLPFPTSSFGTKKREAESGSQTHEHHCNKDIQEAGANQALSEQEPPYAAILTKCCSCDCLAATLGQRKRCPPAEQANNARLDWQLPNHGNIILSEGELLLQALNGFVLVVTTEGDIFYASPTIQEYVGFHQTAVMHQPVYELLHPEDRDEFQRQLHWALDPVPRSNMAQSDSSTNGDVVTRYDPQQLPPENSPFLERNFVCKMRSLLNSPSGYMALNIKGKLKYLYGQNKWAEDGSLLPLQLALFAIATPLQVPSILEIRTRSALFQTKHKLDFSPVACDAKAKSVLGYSELELCMRGSGYQFIHADDMLYCADNHVQLMKTGQSGMTIFRLLTKHNVWIWVQANAYLIYKNGQPDFIIAKQRLLTDKEGMDHFQKRTMPFSLPFLTGEAVLYDHSSPILGLTNSFPLESSDCVVQQSGDVDPNSLFGAMMSQDKAVYIKSPAIEPKYSLSWISGGVGLGGSAPCSQKEEESIEEAESDFKQDDDLLSLLDDMLQSDNDEVFTGLPNVMESLGPEDLELMHWVHSHYAENEPEDETDQQYIHNGRNGTHQSVDDNLHQDAERKKISVTRKVFETIHQEF